MAANLQPDGIGKYSFVPGSKIVFNPPGRQFDTVIMVKEYFSRSSVRLNSRPRSRIGPGIRRFDW